MLKTKVLTGDRSGSVTKPQIRDADRPMELQCSHLRVASIVAGVATDARAFIPGQQVPGDERTGDLKRGCNRSG